MSIIQSQILFSFLNISIFLDLFMANTEACELGTVMFQSHTKINHWPLLIKEMYSQT